MTTNTLLATFFFMFSFTGFCQPTEKVHPSSIISRHLLSTSDEGWDNLRTIQKECEVISNHVNYKYKIWQQFPNLERIERDDGQKIETAVRDGDDGSLSTFGVRVNSIMNYSEGLSRAEHYGILLKSVKDTLIRDTLFFKIKIQKPIDSSYTLDLLLYFDSLKFYLRRVECLDPKYETSIDYSDFRFVHGYIFPFIIKTTRPNSSWTIEKVNYIRVNDTLSPDMFSRQK